MFQGCATAIITPMLENGNVNYDEFGRIIDFQKDNGIDAIIVCGTTGESSTLSDDEHRDVINYCVKKINGDIPVIAGTGSNDTKYAIELSKDAEKLGADGCLVVTPYYNKATQKGLIKHFTAIADSVNIPIILYNVTGRTGVDISVDTYKELSKHQNIIGVKEANSDIVKFARIINSCGEDLTVYSGNDDNAAMAMSIGAKGLISVISNVLPKEFTELTHFCLENEYEKARFLQLKYLDFIDALFCEVNPIPIKQAMEFIGYKAGIGRLPLCEMSESNIAKLKASMEKAQLIVN
ncbi:4-hydroxy-tetrahydrodipicolinate synthase [Clostridia bacterium]|nr:4-hydroxy-tetrahydrodipicolinate synthase [Clostridia bacterium]